LTRGFEERLGGRHVAVVASRKSRGSGRHGDRDSSEERSNPRSDHRRRPNKSTLALEEGVGADSDGCAAWVFALGKARGAIGDVIGVARAGAPRFSPEDTPTGSVANWDAVRLGVEVEVDVGFVVVVSVGVEGMVQVGALARCFSRGCMPSITVPRMQAAATIPKAMSRGDLGFSVDLAVPPLPIGIGPETAGRVGGVQSLGGALRRGVRVNLGACVISRPVSAIYALRTAACMARASGQRALRS
jgi:hypothetical protein